MSGQSVPIITYNSSHQMANCKILCMKAALQINTSLLKYNVTRLSDNLRNYGVVVHTLVSRFTNTLQVNSPQAKLQITIIAITVTVVDTTYLWMVLLNLTSEYPSSNNWNIKV